MAKIVQQESLQLQTTVAVGISSSLRVLSGSLFLSGIILPGIQGLFWMYRVFLVYALMTDFNTFSMGMKEIPGIPGVAIYRLEIIYRYI